jgi:membrane protein YqaA with SNARE-associated domain
MIESLVDFVGIYAGAFCIALISGVFPLVSSELFLVLVARSSASTPRLYIIVALIAVGQTIAHSTLFQTARGVTTLGVKKRKRFETRIARAREVVGRWKGKNVTLLLCSAATVGLPPMMLVSLAAGALEIRFRRFVIIGIIGRLLRFATIATAARYIYR